MHNLYASEVFYKIKKKKNVKIYNHTTKQRALRIRLECVGPCSMSVVVYGRSRVAVHVIAKQKYEESS